DQAEQVIRSASDSLPLEPFRARGQVVDKEEAATLAELEGQIGLTLVDEHDEQRAEDHYRSAMHFAADAEDWKGVNIWGTNVGNACVRRGRYGEAFDTYEQALTAGLSDGYGPGVVNA